MIIKKILLALFATSILLPAAVRAQGIEIQIGDRPFYNHGPRYWAGDFEMVWVPGHMSNGHHWNHGHYIRGEHRRHDDRRTDGQDNHQDDHRR